MHLDLSVGETNLSLLINKTQALIDLSGYGNHYRLTLQK